VPGTFFRRDVRPGGVVKSVDAGEALLLAVVETGFRKLSAPSHRGWPPTPSTPSTPSLHPSNQARGLKRSFQRHPPTRAQELDPQGWERPWSECFYASRAAGRRSHALTLHAEQARAQSARQPPGRPARRVALPAIRDTRAWSTSLPQGGHPPRSTRQGTRNLRRARMRTSLRALARGVGRRPLAASA
jgi:hypothetical protein